MDIVYERDGRLHPNTITDQHPPSSSQRAHTRFSAHNQSRHKHRRINSSKFRSWLYTETMTYVPSRRGEEEEARLDRKSWLTGRLPSPLRHFVWVRGCGSVGGSGGFRTVGRGRSSASSSRPLPDPRIPAHVPIAASFTSLSLLVPSFKFYDRL